MQKTSKKKPAERYLAIPYHILNLTGIALAQKVLLSHIYSFGARGCWQSNETLAEIFMVSGKAISRWVADICRYLYIKKPKGYHRTMWAKSHPDVRQAAALKQDKSYPLHRDNSVQQDGQKCPTTNNKTNRETNRATKTSPAAYAAIVRRIA